MNEVDSTKEIRCHCSRSPLLAKWGQMQDGNVFLHIKVYKQRKLYAEVIVESGNVIRVRCRDCLRWTAITVKREPIATTSELPRKIPTTLSR